MVSAVQRQVNGTAPRGDENPQVAEPST